MVINSKVLVGRARASTFSTFNRTESASGLSLLFGIASPTRSSFRRFGDSSGSQLCIDKTERTGMDN